jgi:hypothetical protein
MDIEIENIKISVKIASHESKDQKLRSIIALDFGIFKIKGFRIMQSEHENRRGQKLWLVPPSYFSGGKYHPIFFMEDKKLWRALEDRIYDEYDKQIMKSSVDEIQEQS